MPGIFGEEKHTSRSQNYSTSPPSPYWKACSGKAFSHSRLPDLCARPGPPGIHKTHAALRRNGEINGEHVPEIILLNFMTVPPATRCCRVTSGSSARRMRLWSVSGGSACSAPGKCGDRVIEGAYEVVGVFDRIEESVMPCSR